MEGFTPAGGLLAFGARERPDPPAATERCRGTMMIDLHSHVLPGIDDGAPDMDTSVELAVAAAADGTRVLAATPHARDDHPGVRVEETAGRCAQLAGQLPPGLELELVPAAEVDLGWAQTASPEQLRLASYAQRGTDLLLETPYGPLPSTFEELVFRITVQGYRILLAHPEISPSFQADPRRLGELVSRGVLLQVSAGSLLRGERRSRSRKLAADLVRDGFAHVIASDSHRGSGWRPPNLAAGRRAAAALAPARAQWMVIDAPAAVLAGEPLPDPPRETATRRGLLGRLRLGG